jgi:hypothetical protein
MDKKHPRFAWILLLLGAAAISGCGWMDSDTPVPITPQSTDAQSTSTGPPAAVSNRATSIPKSSSAPSPAPDPFFIRSNSRTPFSGPFAPQAMNNLARGIATYDIYNVIPDQGTLLGGTQVHLTGVFPAVANATQIYTVYFGYNAASYDASIPNITSAFNMYDIYVIAPPGDMPGLVDLAIVAGIYDVYAFEPLGYEYLDPFAITDVIPPQGILAGGTAIEIKGRFPVLQSLNSIAAASQYYQVTFGGAVAPFRVENGMLPVVSAESMYVTAPPSAATVLGGLPGFVDVTVNDLSSFDSIDMIYTNYRTYTNGYRYGFEITGLQPDQGHYYGGNRVRILGDFLVANGIYNLVDARSTYTVFFDSEMADFDATILPEPIISANNIYVTAPRSPIVPLYNDPFEAIVRIYDRDGLVSFARSEEIQTYNYFTEMKIDFLIPRVGPLTGDTQVDVFGTFPVSNNMYLNRFDNDNFISIFDTYRVLFDVYEASWDIARDALMPSQPLIEINQTYAGYAGYFDVLHMRSPRAFVPGLVDIAAADLSLTDAPVRLKNGYEYTPGSSIGVWIDCDIFPNPVGKLDARELRVVIVTAANGFVDFDTQTRTNVRPVIVPQGGNPNNSDHHIDLELINDPVTLPDNPYVNTNTGFIVSEWTNTRNINTEVFKDSQDRILFADGHAAVYILEPDNESIVGDDYFQPYLDGDLIRIEAHEGRHFIIDTIPPQMYIAETGSSGTFNTAFLNAAGGTNFNNYPLIRVRLPSVKTTSTSTDFLPQNRDGINHPGPTGFGTGFEQFDEPFPFSTPLPNRPSSGIITQYPDSNPEGAQRFANIASISNFYTTNQWAFEPFYFTVRAQFRDYDVHDYYEIFDPITGDFDPNAELNYQTTILDEDLFTGSRKRQTAGFPRLRVVADLFLDTNGDVINDQSNGLARLTRSNFNDLLLARWELQPGSTRLPERTVGPPPSPLILTVEDNSRVTYTGFAGPAPGAGPLRGFVYDLQNPTNEDELNIFEFMDVQWDINGIDPDEIDEFMRLVIKFSGSDRANVYFPRGDTTDTPKGLYTEEERQLDPLQLWWMREANTRFTRSNVPTSGIVRTPRFEWELTGVRPTLVQNPNNPVPIHRYSLWRTGVNTDPDVEFNGDYRLATNDIPGNAGMWSTWSELSALAPQNLFENRWYLLIVNSMDEAGNTEAFPLEDWIHNSDVNGDFVSHNSGGSNQLQGQNWRRFFIEPRENQVDTFIDTTIWHDSRDSSGSFGTIGTIGPVTNPNDGRPFDDQRIIPLPSVTKFNIPNNIRNTIVSALFTVTSTITDPNVDLEYEYSFEREGFLLDQGAEPGLNMAYTALELGDPNRQEPVSYIFRVTAVVNRGEPTTEFRDTTPAQIRFTVVPDRNEFLIQTDKRETFKEFERP